MNRDDSFCPICKTKWNISQFNMKTWKDCSKCKRTYESIMEEMENSPPPLPNSVRKRQDIIEEFELMLNNLDDLDLHTDGWDVKNWCDDFDDDDEF